MSRDSESSALSLPHTRVLAVRPLLAQLTQPLTSPPQAPTACPLSETSSRSRTPATSRLPRSSPARSRTESSLLGTILRPSISSRRRRVESTASSRCVVRRCSISHVLTGRFADGRCLHPRSRRDPPGLWHLDGAAPQRRQDQRRYLHQHRLEEPRGQSGPFCSFGGR